LAETLVETEGTHVQHHFADAEQQLETATLGMWTFLITEVLFFGGMFASYAIYRSMYPAAFESTSRFMDIRLGGTNTAVLICSSLTMAMAVRSAQVSKRKPLIMFLALTMFLGLVFLGIKAIEYTNKWNEHLVPGFHFQYEPAQFMHNAQLLFFLYFCMTGMHALHMIIGIGLLTTLIIMAARNSFSATYYTPVEMIGLYWHFVDIVWIFLFPLLYLIGHHG
jgi:cytochrome c oxidase subunit 3